MPKSGHRKPLRRSISLRCGFCRAGALQVQQNLTVQTVPALHNLCLGFRTFRFACFHPRVQLLKICTVLFPDVYQNWSNHESVLKRVCLFIWISVSMPALSCAGKFPTCGEKVSLCKYILSLKDLASDVDRQHQPSLGWPATAGEFQRAVLDWKLRLAVPGSHHHRGDYRAIGLLRALGVAFCFWLRRLEANGQEVCRAAENCKIMGRIWAYCFKVRNSQSINLTSPRIPSRTWSLQVS